MIIKLLYNIQRIECVFKIMSIKINYLKKLSNKTSGNVVLFTDEKFNIDSLKKYLSNSEFEIYFFKLPILNFSSTNKTRFAEILIDPVFL